MYYPYNYSANLKVFNFVLRSRIGWLTTVVDSPVECKKDRGRSSREPQRNNSETLVILAKEIVFLYNFVIIYFTYSNNTTLSFETFTYISWVWSLHQNNQPVTQIYYSSYYILYSLLYWSVYRDFRDVLIKEKNSNNKRFIIPQKCQTFLCAK